MTVKEMGRRVKARRPFYFSQWSHFLCKYPRVMGSAPRGVAGSQVLSSLTNFKSFRQVASYAIC